MSPDLVTAQRELYEAMWECDEYAAYAPGEQYADLFCDMTQTTMRGSVLDAGCGTGKGALALQARGFSVRLCDLTPAGLMPEAKTLPFTEACVWHDLKRQIGFADWVYCCDVLEHLPTAYVALAVTRLLGVARRGAFFSVALHGDAFGMWVGQPLHQTVWRFDQWRDLFNELGVVQECRDLLSTGIYLVRSR
jgi:SAM-dependent methyltransferase